MSGIDRESTAAAPAMERVACPVCGASSSREMFRLRRDRTLVALGVRPAVAVKVMCDRCGHVYQTPQLTSDALRRLYRDIFRSPSMGYHSDLPSDDYLYWKRIKAQRDFAWLMSHLPHGISKGAVLEVGCSEGLLLSFFREHGWEVLGVEPTSSYAAYAKERFGIPVINALLEDANLGDRRFDIVVSLETVEHAKDPRGFLRSMRQLLKPTGLLFISVPCVLIPKGHPASFLGSHHLSLFTPDSLRLLLEQAGFRVLRSDTEKGSLAALASPASFANGGAVPPDTLPSRAKVRAGLWWFFVRSRVLDAWYGSIQAVKHALIRLLGTQRGERVWRLAKQVAGVQGNGKESS